MARRKAREPGRSDRKKGKVRENRGGRPAASSRKRDTARRRHAEELIVVGVGASAGGLEAISELLSALPADTGMAFVFVQHLAPKHESVLPILLKANTRMPVVQVTHGVKVEPDHLYVIPPDRQMELADGHLTLSPRPAGRAQYMPIDYFFRSLARAAGSRAVGIVLSGTASDGALGLREIKAAGGIVLAQTPESAHYGGMPHAAIATGIVDLVLSPRDMGSELLRISRHPAYRAATAPAPETPPDEPAADDAELRRIYAMLRSAKGVDFSLYKPPTIRRRIHRRMALHKIDKIEQYTLYLRENPVEVESLYHDILIQVTHFFREPEALEALASKVFRKMGESRRGDGPVRIWIPGCATGEEAYSVAIVLLESLGDETTNISIQVFGTDISDAAIEFARSGVYPESIAEHVSAERLRRFFTRSDGNYRVTKLVRDLCIFARQDLTRDPPFSRLDLIVCRNVLIYLGTPLQKKLMTVFHYALRPDGVLLLGKAETVGPGMEFFSIMDKKHRLFQKRAREVPPAVIFPHDYALQRGSMQNRRTFPVERSAASILGQASQFLLEKYSPPGVVVDSNLQIVQFRGQTGPYLEPAPGHASLSLLKMAREGLLYGLRAALHSARKKGQPVRKEGLRVRYDGQQRSIALEVVPLGTGEQERHFLIIFREEASMGSSPRKSLDRAAPEETSAGVARLKQELAANRDYLQSMIQDLEAANEELQSANEEILSSNEELQSTNEELDTAKEELQSINEELNTVNEELHGRNEELSRANSDLMNLLNSVQIAIVMVSADLRIRRFTPTAEKLLNLIPADVGRPIGNIQPNLEGSDLQNLIQEVIDTMTVREHEVRDRSGHWYSMTVRPYKSARNQIDGAVLALYDVDASRRLERSAAHAGELARALADTVLEPVLVVSHDLRAQFANRAFYRRLDVAEADVVGRPLAELGEEWLRDRKLEDRTRKALLEGNERFVHQAGGLRVQGRGIAGHDGQRSVVLVLTEESEGSNTGA
ncbi:MAG TPA: chemotaxis protein CheB [Candidatus Polarisedimenticolia bacterium]|nr:chemotaxis protein CheB [Candidatus Polarisedimenticolia bacterium]